MCAKISGFALHLPFVSIVFLVLQFETVAILFNMLKVQILTGILFFYQYFADRDIFCAGRVSEEDLQRVAAATGGTVQTSVNNVIDEVSPLNFLHSY